METLFSNPINILSTLSRLINDELDNKSYSLIIPPQITTFLKSFSIYNKPANFLLFKTLLRFSDAKKVDYQLATKNKYIVIKQRKTNKPIQINFILYNKELEKFFLHHTNFELFFNYNSLRSEIKRQQLTYFNNLKVNYNSDTHFYRHLITSILSNQGERPETLSQNLGHFSKTTLFNYIHNELMF